MPLRSLRKLLGVPTLKRTWTSSADAVCTDLSYRWVQWDQSSPVHCSCELPGTCKMSPSQCLFPRCSPVCRVCLCLRKSTISSLVSPASCWKWFYFCRWWWRDWGQNSAVYRVNRNWAMTVPSGPLHCRQLCPTHSPESLHTVASWWGSRGSGTWGKGPPPWAPACPPKVQAVWCWKHGKNQRTWSP